MNQKNEIDYSVNVYPAIDEQGFDVLSRNQLMGWRYEEAAAYKWALGIANDNIAKMEAELETLKTVLKVCQEQLSGTMKP